MNEKKIRTPENVRKKIIELRGNQSRSKFASLLGTKDYTIRGIEEGVQKVPHELAISLEKETGIPREWWKTGEGPMELEDDAVTQAAKKFFYQQGEQLGLSEEQCNLWASYIANKGDKDSKLWIEALAGNKESLAKLQGIISVLEGIKS